MAGRAVISRGRRIALAALAVSGLYVGIWASFLPRRFFDSFPGLGRHWTSVDGPYNEHLVRDVGAFYLALTLCAVLAFAWRDRRTTLLTGAAWSIFSVLHLGYHLGHLGPFGTFDKVGMVLSLGGTLVIALWLSVPQRDAD